MRPVRFFPFMLVWWLLLMLTGTQLIAQSRDAVISHFPDKIRERLLDVSQKAMLQRANELVADFTTEWERSSALRTTLPFWDSLPEVLDANGFKTYPHLYNIVQSALAFARAGQSQASLSAWMEEVLVLVDSKKIKFFENFLNRSIELALHSKLGGKGSTAWYMREGSFYFSRDTALFAELDQLQLVSPSRRDSILIRNTKGRLHFHSMCFNGKGGQASWQRFQLKEEEQYVLLQSFTIDLTLPSIQADSALLFFPKYFERPMLGQFQDKVFSGPPTSKTQYPKFQVYLSDLEIRNVFPEIDFNGSIRIEGLQIYGTANNNEACSVLIKRGKKNQVVLRSELFVLTNNRIQSENASLTIYLGQDSLYHAGLWMRYDHNTHFLTLNRSVKGIGDAPFIDTYHQVNLYTEAMYWDIRSDSIDFRQMEGLSSVSVARIESLRLFSDEYFNNLLGIDDRHPVYLLDEYMHKYDTKGVLKAAWVAEYMRKPPEQIIALFLRLAAKGYLSYDANTQTAFAGERFQHIIQAKAGRSDYDLIAIQSHTTGRNPNLRLDLNSNDMTINGVEEIVLSEAHGVQLFPEQHTIQMKQNRDFVFSGLVSAGLFDFYAREASFEYDPFKLNFTFVDSMSFVVKERNQDTDKPFPEYVKVKNVLSNLTGTLYIDEPDNKSGRMQLARYPGFTSTGESYVYFDHPATQQGSLKREDFYYVVDPFEIDSLDNFSTDNLHFDGYLNSAGIFPVFRQPLIVMEDYSLGFEHITPEEGYPIYGGSGQYMQSISLSNQGLHGWGALYYLTSETYSKDFIFYPDSVAAIADEVHISMQRQVPEFPDGIGTELQMRWDIKQELMSFHTIEHDFQLYDRNKFYGNLSLKPGGLTGDGDIRFGQAQLQSNYFQFLSMSFGADTADFRLFPPQGNKEAFMATAYKTFVDYEQRQAIFEHLDDNSKLSFPFNRYYCTLDEAVWMMDEQRIRLNNNKVEGRYNFEALSLRDIMDLDLQGSVFVSEHPQQDSLAFFCLQADYDLNEYAIVARDVKIIQVADAAVFPTDGIVTILEDAAMKPLESATIITDMTSKMHQINQAKVAIHSSKRYTASGLYTYSNLNDEKFVLNMPEITVSDQGHTQGKAVIQAQDGFYLSPWFAFSGEALLDAATPYLRFNGGVQLIHSCVPQELPWIRFDTIIDPMNVSIPIHNGLVDIHGKPINNGLYYATVNDSYYAAFLQEPKGADKAAAFIGGTLVYDRSQSAYHIMQTEAGIDKAVLSMHTNRCVIEGKSAIDLDLKTGHLDLDIYGDFIYKIIPDSLYLNVFARLSFPFDDKLLASMADSLNAANLPGAVLNQGNYLPALRNLINGNEADRISNEVALYGAPRKIPEALQPYIVFSELKLKWVPDSRAFVSVGANALANILKTGSNKMIDGFLEIEKSRAGDGISFYLMVNARQWYFFSYKTGVMQALSSSDLFNTDLMKIKQDKRVVNDPAKGGRYEYIIATRRKMVDFLRKMQSMEL